MAAGSKTNVVPAVIPEAFSAVAGNVTDGSKPVMVNDPLFPPVAVAMVRLSPSMAPFALG